MTDSQGLAIVLDGYVFCKVYGWESLGFTSLQSEILDSLRENGYECTIQEKILFFPEPTNAKNRLKTLEFHRELTELGWKVIYTDFKVSYPKENINLVNMCSELCVREEIQHIVIGAGDGDHSSTLQTLKQYAKRWLVDIPSRKEDKTKLLEKARELNSLLQCRSFSNSQTLRAPQIETMSGILVYGGDFSFPVDTRGRLFSLPFVNRKTKKDGTANILAFPDKNDRSKYIRENIRDFNTTLVSVQLTKDGEFKKFVKEERREPILGTVDKSRVSGVKILEEELPDNVRGMTERFYELKDCGYVNRIEVPVIETFKTTNQPEQTLSLGSGTERSIHYYTYPTYTVHDPYLTYQRFHTC
jgi:hypothetical protein